MLEGKYVRIKERKFGVANIQQAIKVGQEVDLDWQTKGEEISMAGQREVAKDKERARDLSK